MKKLTRPSKSFSNRSQLPRTTCDGLVMVPSRTLLEEQTEHLLRDFRHRRCAALQGTARREGRKVRHEEVEPREGNEVDRTLPHIAIQLAWESDARRHPADGGRHDMVQVSVDRNRPLQSTKTDVAQRLVSSSVHSSAPNASVMRSIWVFTADLRDQKAFPY